MAKEFSMSPIISPTDNGIMEEVRSIIPKLSNDRHKGQAGRIGIVGGSKEYPGKDLTSMLRSIFRSFSIVQGQRIFLQFLRLKLVPIWFMYSVVKVLLRS